MWTENQSDVKTFAHVLVRAGVLTNVDETLYYFEKPHKYDTERKLWVDSGSPLDGNCDGWELFAKRLEKTE